MGREKIPSKRFVGRPLRNTARDASRQATRQPTQATMSSLAPQQRDTPHQGPAGYTNFQFTDYVRHDESDNDEGHMHEQVMEDAADAEELSGYRHAPYNPTDAGDLTHERARELLIAQATRLLPPAEANALADHLLVCDACYRFAQDVAAQRRNAHANP